MFTDARVVLRLATGRRRGPRTAEAIGAASRHRLTSNLVQSITCVVKVGPIPARHPTCDYHKPSVALVPIRRLRSAFIGVLCRDSGIALLGAGGGVWEPGASCGSARRSRTGQLCCRSSGLARRQGLAAGTYRGESAVIATDLAD